MAFIDRITISQKYPGILNEETGELMASIPVVDDGVVGKVLTQEDGSQDVEWYTHCKRKHEGSFDSLVIIRSDGHLVELEGNIGRLNRPDNLFNLDYLQTLQACNTFAQSYGLPGFSTGEVVEIANPCQYDIDHNNLTMWTGASVSNMHLTENYITGNQANAEAFLTWLSTQSLPRVSKNHYSNETPTGNTKKGHSGVTTVTWGRGGSRFYLKAYNKAAEMIAHAKNHGLTIEQVKASPVYQFCLEHGVVRFELECGRLLLRDNQLRYIGDAIMHPEKIQALFDSYVDPLISRVREDVTAVDLEALDIPVGAKLAAECWLRGGDPRRQYKNRMTFSRHRNLLKQYGFDISEPLNKEQKFSSVFKVVELTKLDTAPAWYWDHQARMTARAVNGEPYQAEVAA